MEENKQILVLGDSILKGIQVDPETGKYIIKNEMDALGLETEFHLSIQNKSHFGATCLNGDKLLNRLLDRGFHYDAVVMDFGGNDCNHDWAAVAADPTGEHFPLVPLADFTERYRALIRKVKAHGMTPIVTTLPPLVPQRFFNWWCRDLDQAAVRQWLGCECNIYAHQEKYSRTVERLAWEEQIPLVDIRGAFLENGRLGTLMCADGTHPNSAGQALITKAFRDFCHEWESHRMPSAFVS